MHSSSFAYGNTKHVTGNTRDERAAQKLNFFSVERPLPFQFLRVARTFASGIVDHSESLTAYAVHGLQALEAKSDRNYPVLPYLLACWLFHAITFEQSSFRENPTYFLTFVRRWVCELVFDAFYGWRSEFSHNRQNE